MRLRAALIAGFAAFLTVTSPSLASWGTAGAGGTYFMETPGPSSVCGNGLFVHMAAYPVQTYGDDPLYPFKWIHLTVTGHSTDPVSSPSRRRET